MTWNNFDKLLITADASFIDNRIHFCFTSENLCLRMDFKGTSKDAYLVKSIINRLKKYEKVEQITLLICGKLEDQEKVREFFDTVDQL